MEEILGQPLILACFSRAVGEGGSESITEGCSPPAADGGVRGAIVFDVFHRGLAERPVRKVSKEGFLRTDAGEKLQKGQKIFELFGPKPPSVPRILSSLCVIHLR